jgi:hypothetical protein
MVVVCAVLLWVESKTEEAEPVRRVIINGLVLAVLAGCSCGSWVDLAVMSGASCKELEDMKKPDSKAALASFARQTCSTSGKSWTGDTRCDKDSVQVKCK